MLVRQRAGSVLRGPDLRAHLGALRRRGRLRRMEVRTPIHGAGLFGLAVRDQDRHRRRRLPAAVVPGSLRLCERRRADTHGVARHHARLLARARDSRAAESRRPCDLSAQPEARGRNRTGTGRPPRRRVSWNGSPHDHPQSHPPRLQSRPVHRPRRATITTSPPRPSSGFPACRFIIRATSSTGDCSRARSVAPASSTCWATPIPAASGRRA